VKRNPYEIHESLAGVTADWDTLADAVGAPPFARPGWFHAWLGAFGDGRLELIVIRRDGRLAGVMPLLRRRGVLRSATNWHTPVYATVAEDAAAYEALCAAALERAGHRLDVAFLDSADPVTALLRSAPARRVVERTVLRSPYVAIEGDFDRYRTSLGRKFRKELGRLERRAAEAGSLEYGFERGGDRLEELLDEGFRIEGSGWKAENGTAITSRDDTHRFYREVARWAAGRGILVLAFLRLDGQAVAFDMCIEDGGASYVLKGGFDAGRRKLAPGTLLTARSIQRAFENGLDSYELLGAADDYKLQWTETVRERVRIQAFSGSPAGRASHLAWTHGRTAARRARSALAR
jgi:CelD/BcsL family acetyltransferase involved in cellulose biosynthesis